VTVKAPTDSPTWGPLVTSAKAGAAKPSTIIKAKPVEQKARIYGNS
jgi:hypothetical protein